MRRRTTYQPMTCRQAAAARETNTCISPHCLHCHVLSCRMHICRPQRRLTGNAARRFLTLPRWAGCALQVEEGTPFARRYSPGEAPLPSDDAAAAMYCAASTVLGAAGGPQWPCLPAACLLPAAPKPPAVPCRLPVDHARTAVSTTMPRIAPTAACRCPGGPPMKYCRLRSLRSQQLCAARPPLPPQHGVLAGGILLRPGPGQRLVPAGKHREMRRPCPCCCRCRCRSPCDCLCCCPRSAAAGAATWAAVPPPNASPANCYPPPPSPCRAVGSAGPSG
jgi:hypothetical protein